MAPPASSDFSRLCGPGQIQRDPGESRGNSLASAAYVRATPRRACLFFFPPPPPPASPPRKRLAPFIFMLAPSYAFAVFRLASPPQNRKHLLGAFSLSPSLCRTGKNIAPRFSFVIPVLFSFYPSFFFTFSRRLVCNYAFSFCLRAR